MPQDPAGFVPDAATGDPPGFVPDAPARIALPASLTQRLAAWLPAVGGGVGQLAGGISGATLGAAAGEGYRQLVQHAGEIPGAIADVARNLVTEPRATIEGALSGATSGAVGATEQGVAQGAIPGAIGVGLGKVMGAAAPALMQSAVKPGLKASMKAVVRGSDIPVVKTLLDEGVNVSSGGIAKLSDLITASNDTIKDALTSLPASSHISKLQVTSRLTPTAQQFANQVNPVADLAQISEAGHEFLAHPSLPNATMTPLEAQAMKTGTYAALKSKSYGELKGAAIEAQKALARGLKEEIANEAAKAGLDLTAINAREGAAIEARDAIAKRIALAGNRDPAGLAWLAHSPVTALVYILERSPATKSLIARGLYQSAGYASGVAPNVIRAAVAGVASLPESQQEP